MKKAPSGGKETHMGYDTKIHIITDLSKSRAGFARIFHDAGILVVTTALPLVIGLEN